MFSRLTFKSSLLSILLHVAAVLLLVLSFDFTSRQVKPAPQINAVEAVAVDSTQVEKELQRLKDLDAAKEQEKLEKQRLLERQAREAETKRKTEEQRLADVKKKKEQEQKSLEEEQKKMALQKKEQENLERKREAEAEKQRKEEEAKKKTEAEQKKRQAEEAAHQKQLAEQQAAQQRADQSLMQGVIANIYQDVRNNFNIVGLPPGLECVLLVRTVPGGEVVGVQVSKSSGNEIFDRRAQDAVQKASPLPLPADSATFERLGLRQFNLRFRPQ